MTSKPKNKSDFPFVREGKLHHQCNKYEARENRACTIATETSSKGSLVLECLFSSLQRRHGNPIFKRRRLLNNTNRGEGDRDEEGGDGII